MADGAKDKASGSKEERLAAQLRANLSRRKTQARARRQGEADAREGIEPAERKADPTDTD